MEWWEPFRRFYLLQANNMKETQADCPCDLLSGDVGESPPTIPPAMVGVWTLFLQIPGANSTPEKYMITRYHQFQIRPWDWSKIGLLPPMISLRKLLWMWYMYMPHLYFQRVLSMVIRCNCVCYMGINLAEIFRVVSNIIQHVWIGGAITLLNLSSAALCCLFNRVHSFNWWVRGSQNQDKTVTFLLQCCRLPWKTTPSYTE